MNLSTLLLLITHIPESSELAEASAALATTPELVRFNAALAAFQAAMGAQTADAPPQAPEPSMSVGGHPSGVDSGRMSPGS